MTSPSDGAVSLPAALVALRVKHGWSKPDLARAVGASARQVKRWENEGAIPEGVHRQRLIDLGVPKPLFTDPKEIAELAKRLRRLQAEVAQILAQLGEH